MLLKDYGMTIHDFACLLQIDFNPPEIIAIYATAKAFNMDSKMVTEHLEWYCPRVADNRSALDLNVFLIFNG